MKKLCLIVCLIAMLAGCSQTPKNDPEVTDFTNELLVTEKLIVGTSPDYPPFESLDATGNVEGFDIDMLNEVVKILNAQNGTNITIEWKTMEFGTIIGALEAKQVDAGLSAFTYEEGRNAAFSTPYLLSSQVVVVKADSNIKTVADLEGKNIAVQTGTTGESAAEGIANANLSSLSDYSVMFQMLNAGNVDAVVCDNAVADNYVNNMGFVKFEQPLIDENMSVIFHLDNVKLTEAMNKAIEEFVASEAYTELKAKWEIAD